MTRTTLYAIPGSHPSAAAAAWLDAHGVTYDRVDLVPVLSRLWLRAARFPGSTVPALRLHGRAVVGSRAIMRATGDPRDAEKIERWADEDLQRLVRRIALWGIARSRAGVASILGDTRLRPRLPHAVALALAPVALRLDGAINGASEAAVRADLAALPGILGRIDGWLAGGNLGGDPPAAADYQVAGSLRLLLAFDDLQPLLDGRPGAELARRLIPRFEGRVPPVFPQAWLPRA